MKGLDIEALVDTFADLVAERVASRLGDRSPTGPARWVRPDEYARARAVHVRTVHAWIRAGRLDAERIGKRQWRIRADAELRPASSTSSTSPATSTEPPASIESDAAWARRILGGRR